VWANLFRPLTHNLHPVVATAIVAGFVVVSLAWGVMPLLTRLLNAWLYSANQQA
jgi:antibiotic biosynthesis monooxygenase (ABM) superfamily enzyme